MIRVMETKSLREIRVKDLCEKSGADRHTFYYHFRDKYELVAWVYASGAEESMGGPDGHMGIEQSAASLSLVKQNKMFYRKAFEDKSRTTTSSGGLNSPIRACCLAALKGQFRKQFTWLP